MHLRPTLLPALGVFAAAARHQNFAHAAEELHLTASAVSHHVRKLEALLGATLFQRLPRGVMLTAEGRQLADAASAALAEIAAVAGNLHPREDAIPLRVTTLRSLSYCWLLPRLPRFCRLHPHIRLDLQSDPAFSRFEEGGPEVGIRYGQGAWPGLTSHHLMDDELFPVASPSLPEVAALQTPAQIAQLPLLSDMSPQGWRDWFRAAQVRGTTLPPMHTFNDSTDAMRAAVYGLGAVLARKHIAQPYLQRYELVRLPGPTLKARYAYYIVHPSHRAPSPAATVFIDWLKREALDERTPMPALPAELLALPTGETAHAPDRRRRSRRAPATE
ncbi:LysR family transcriptional regulator [Xanthomonas campestris]|uniref:Transcriptional regulator n=3 Tax=Xanthomonas campestris pv. campestris TaxID=340 RepID=Q8P7I4_XANCP|nr:LysR substrate-binding domain-containing protein [Xanthomonas campestris]AAM41899.1 transcriptional regulator [Xanthomonas campestris pv. campestris str. ATCC 33913]AAY48558.1 transcriptional regulator [Xanthomonas campestris pv. campestris str. 8004]AKS15757.1 LysR family transcriptional regulator [Xanthomonas campestris pv. campestris]AKS19777.1 LysR family transcriptional regulator [Xanthomonas campestris pv. campestris]ALE69317.1 LysR family transcriptional regulator [Xanthomonas campes